MQGATNDDDKKSSYLNDEAAKRQKLDHSGMADRIGTALVTSRRMHRVISTASDNINVNLKANVPEYNNYRLMELKKELNKAKSRLDQYHGLQRREGWQWRQINRLLDVYQPMRQEIERVTNAQCVTNAWMKYLEIFRTFDMLPREQEWKEESDGKFKAFFNAELPGAAVCTFNHEMKTRCKSVPFEWWASSLAPDQDDEEQQSNTNCLGDQYGLYERNKTHWLMEVGKRSTKDKFVNNGDVTIVDNLLDFERRIGPGSDVGGVHLYSHDAGIDVSEGADGGLGFNDQELANAKIHLGCALAGFMTLRKGGNFVAKQYTFFETFTWNLIAIYSSMFESFDIFKPITSRPRNSEIYLIGLGFKGMPSEVRSVLIRRMKDFSTRPFLEEEFFKKGKSASFLFDLNQFGNKVLFGRQINFLNLTVDLFENGDFDMVQDAIRKATGVKDHKSGVNKSTDKWQEMFPLKKIDDKDKLPSREHINWNLQKLFKA